MTFWSRLWKRTPKTPEAKRCLRLVETFYSNNKGDKSEYSYSIEYFEDGKWVPVNDYLLPTGDKERACRLFQQFQQPVDLVTPRTTRLISNDEAKEIAPDAPERMTSPSRQRDAQ